MADWHYHLVFKDQPHLAERSLYWTTQRESTPLRTCSRKNDPADRSTSDLQDQRAFPAWCHHEIRISNPLSINPNGTFFNLSPRFAVGAGQARQRHQASQEDTDRRIDVDEFRQILRQFSPPNLLIKSLPCSF